MIVLSTEEPGMTGRIGYYGVGDSRNSAQADFLVNTLRTHANDQHTYLVVALHRPITDPKPHESFDVNGERLPLEQLFARYGVDLVLNGHVHAYVRHVMPNGQPYVTVGTGGSPLYSPRTTVTTSPGTDARRIFGHYGFTLFRVNAEGMAATTFSLDPSTGKWRVTDRFSVPQQRPRRAAEPVTVTGSAPPASREGERHPFDTNEHRHPDRARTEDTVNDSSSPRGSNAYRQAVILVGGEGSRLRPITSRVPKPAAPLLGRPFISYILENLVRHGVDRVVFSTGYLAAAIEAEVGDGGRYGLDVRYASEDSPLGTAGAIKNAASELRPGGFLVLNGDILTDADLSAIVAFHRERNAAATLLTTAVDDPSRYGLVDVRTDGRVASFVEKPGDDWPGPGLINAGVYVLEHEVLDLVPSRQEFSIERGVFPSLAASGSLYAFVGTGYWRDIGTPQSYLHAHFDLLRDSLAVGKENPSPSPPWHAFTRTPSSSPRCMWAGMPSSNAVRRWGH